MVYLRPGSIQYEDAEGPVAGPSKIPKPSFFSSDDEDDIATPDPTPKRKRIARSPMPKKLEEKEKEKESNWTIRTPSRGGSRSSSQQSPICISDDSGDESSNYVPSPQKSVSPPPPKRRRLSSPPIVEASRLSIDPGPSEPLPLRPTSPEPTLTSTFLGHIVVDDAWTTCGGKGLLAAGDVVRIYRDGEEAQQTIDPHSVANGQKGKKATAGKQQTLSSMLSKRAAIPPAAPKKKKTKEDVIVRFANPKGQEVGRLPNRIAVWASKLLDKSVVKIAGTVIECPSPLRTGCHILLSLRFDFLPSAFGGVDPVDQLAPRNSFEMMKEGSETDMERFYSERKKSLLELFGALSLRPVQKGKKRKDLDAAAIAFAKARQKPSGEKGKQTEVVGEGEEQEEVEAEGEELNKNQLDVIYKKAQQNDKDMGEADPPDSFALKLRPYQRQALLWMSSIETGSSVARDAASMHPLWEQYAFPYEPTGDVIDLCADEDVFYYNPYSGQLSLKFPRAERNCRGGILADEMGMGKSIMIASLIHTNRGPDNAPPNRPPSPEPAGKPSAKQGTLKFNGKSKGPDGGSAGAGPSATLIVAPLSLLAQWKSELDRSSKNGTLKTMVYHGSGTSKIGLESMVDPDDASEESVDVVITSYGTLASEHAKSLRGGSSSLYQVEWMRVVLDEAHYAKSRNTKTAKACYALRARRRWALTGTPIVNRLEDLFSLLHFLRDEPWSDFAFFKSCVIVPFLQQDPKCLDVVQIILESILLRREKSMKDRNGNPIVSLPPKKVVTKELEFSAMERKIYDSIFSDAKNAYDRFNARGVVGKNFSNILAMLMRLRRAVLHPSLIQPKRDADDDDEIMEIDGPGSTGDDRLDLDAMIAKFGGGSGPAKEEDRNPFAVDVLKNVKNIESQECPLCLDNMDDPVLVPECHHAGCKACIIAHIHDQEEKGNVGFCPVCQRRPIKENSLIEVIVRRKAKLKVNNDEGSETPNNLGHSASSPEIVLRQNDFVGSTKLDSLVQHLRQLQEQDPTFRAVVFSQFTGFLDLIEIVLRREGFEQYRLDGTLSQKKRSQVLQGFAEPSSAPKIFAISLKAGGVGLNLTNANHVFMMDCWWNSAVESQAVDRVHRIGQEKTVYVTHFIISKTIEDRILAIQRRKTAIIKGALGGGEAGTGKVDKEAFENLKIMFES